MGSSRPSSGRALLTCPHERRRTAGAPASTRDRAGHRHVRQSSSCWRSSPAACSPRTSASTSRPTPPSSARSSPASLSAPGRAASPAIDGPAPAHPDAADLRRHARDRIDPDRASARGRRRSGWDERSQRDPRAVGLRAVRRRAECCATGGREAPAPRPDRTGATVGRLSAWGTAGAIVGTFLAGYVLVAFAAVTTLIITVGVLLIAAGIVMWFARGVTDPTVMLSAGGLAALSLVGAITTPTPCDVQSAYYCISVKDDPDRPPDGCWCSTTSATATSTSTIRPSSTSGTSGGSSMRSTSSPRPDRSTSSRSAAAP